MYENLIGRIASIPYTKETFLIKEIREIKGMALAYSEDGIVVNVGILLNEKGLFLTEEKEDEAQDDVRGNQEGTETQEKTS